MTARSIREEIKKDIENLSKDRLVLCQLLENVDSVRKYKRFDVRTEHKLQEGFTFNLGQHDWCKGKKFFDNYFRTHTRCDTETKQFTLELSYNNFWFKVSKTKVCWDGFEHELEHQIEDRDGVLANRKRQLVELDRDIKKFNLAVHAAKELFSGFGDSSLKHVAREASPSLNYSNSYGELVA